MFVEFLILIYCVVIVVLSRFITVQFLLLHHHGKKKEESGCIDTTKLESVKILGKGETMLKVADDYGVRRVTVKAAIVIKADEDYKSCSLF